MEEAVWSVYLLVSHGLKRTYVGCTRTNQLSRRLRQHNGEIKGGARATRGHRPWQMVLSIDGMIKRSALQLEWRLHRPYSPRGYAGRFEQIASALSMERWTMTSIPMSEQTKLKVNWKSSSIERPNSLSRWLRAAEQVEIKL